MESATLATMKRAKVWLGVLIQALEIEPSDTSIKVSSVSSGVSTKIEEIFLSDTLKDMEDVIARSEEGAA